MFEFRSLYPEEIEKWFDHCTYVFNIGENSSQYRQYFVNHFYNDPWRDTKDILVAMDGDVIASTVRIFKRNIWIMGVPIAMGGIGEVSTKPEYRGKGLIAQLIYLAKEKMKVDNIKVSMLAGSENIYYRFGWRNISRSWKTFKLSNEAVLPYTIRPVNYEADAPEIKAIYSEYSNRNNGALVRDDLYYWEKWFATEAKNCYTALDASERIIAYMCLSNDNHDLYLQEFAASLGYEHIFDNFVSKICTLIDNEYNSVIFPSIIRSELPAESFPKEDYWMVKLIDSFELNGERIDTTEELISLLYGEGNPGLNSSFYFWDIDGF